MEDNDDPYRILGVEKNATQQTIKASYRKLALQFHPDKQTTDAARQAATVKFAKLSNAYEILGDEQQRRQYDLETSSGRGGANKMPRRTDSFHHPQNFHAQFHDPFSVFESFFRNEFGGDPFANNRNMRQQRTAFDDPFFGGGFGGFGPDPFFGGGGPMMGGPMMGGGLFGAMNQQMNGMMNMHQNMMHQNNVNHMQNPQQQQQQQSFVFTSTSSNIMGGRGGGESVTQSTTTRMVNGKRQVVKENIVRKADGTVERHVDLSGDDDFPGSRHQLLEGNGSSGQHQPRQALEWQQQHQRPPPARPSQRRSSETPEHNRKKKSPTKNPKEPRNDSKVTITKRKRRDSSKTAAEPR